MGVYRDSNMNYTTETILNVVTRLLPNYEITGSLSPLSGGYLNFVWKLQAKPQNLVIKQAPPYIASQPDIPMDPERILFEGRALSLFMPGGPLHKLWSNRVHTPKLLAMDEKDHLLIMEDLGTLPDLSGWLYKNDPKDTGTRLGSFIGRLHGQTFGNADLKKRFNNKTIQQTRFAIQYDAIEDMLKRAGIADYKILGEKTRTMGKKFLEPGLCLTMGDLWPCSILVENGKIRLIDWEFCHFGYPAQDVGHLLAHLWMQAHCASYPVVAGRFDLLRRQFLNSYIQNVGDEPALWNDSTREDIGLHAAAEILARTVGSFQKGYLYAGLGIDHPLMREAVEKAESWITTNRLNS